MGAGSQVTTSSETIKSSAKSSTKIQSANPSRAFVGYLVEIILWILLLTMAAIEFGPISWIFATSLRNPSDSFNLPPDFLPTAFHWENYVAVVNSPQINFLRFFWNSLRIA